MRIKQKDIQDKEPEYQYSRYVNGSLAVVQLFNDPKCVNIVQSKEGHIIRHCYPLTDAQYHGYVCECLNWYNPDKDMFRDMANKAIVKMTKTRDPNMQTFFMNVAMCYFKRCGNMIQTEREVTVVKQEIQNTVKNIQDNYEPLYVYLGQLVEELTWKIL